jgi:hypothetical protein
MENDENTDNTPFDPQLAMQRLTQGISSRPGRKLTFKEQCGAFYALYNGLSASVVSEAFSLSKTTVSNIGGCLERDPRPRVVEAGDGTLIEQRDLNARRGPNRSPRYQAVASEFLRLGDEEFARRYFTRTLFDRLMRVKYGQQGG